MLAGNPSPSLPPLHPSAPNLSSDSVNKLILIAHVHKMFCFLIASIRGVWPDCGRDER